MEVNDIRKDHTAVSSTAGHSKSLLQRALARPVGAKGRQGQSLHHRGPGWKGIFSAPIDKGCEWAGQDKNENSEELQGAEVLPSWRETELAWMREASLCRGQL